jgi:hypothetical protein
VSTSRSGPEILNDAVAVHRKTQHGILTRSPIPEICFEIAELLKFERSSEMKKALGVAFVLTLVAMPALAQKVTVDYAHDFDFSGVKTFQYVDTKESNAKNELMAGRIVELIKKELREGGLTEVQENPDIFVTYHVTTQELSSFNTTSVGYGGYGGYGLGWGGWGGYHPMGGMGTSTTYETKYTEGTLIVDGYEPTDKKLVWRGTGTVTVKAKPDKQIKQVEKILTKIGARWEKILAGKGE